MERDGEAAAASSPRAAEWRDLVISFVAQEADSSQDALTIRIIGSVIWTALSTALSSWAMSNIADPGEYVARARLCLASIEQSTH